MLYSKSVEYAVRALASLAEAPQGSYRMARQIAEEEGMPVFFLAKTLQTLARQGILNSVKGPSGGFGLAVPAKKVRIIDVVAALDGADGVSHSHEELPGFRQVRASIVSYLKKTTVADVAAKRAREKRAAGRKKASKKARKR